MDKQLYFFDAVVVFNLINEASMKIFLLLVLLFVSACSETDQLPLTSELEGSWESICLSSFSSLGFSGQSGSNTIVTTYAGNSISTVVNNYSDADCSQLESTVDASQSSLFVSPGSVPESFVIGDVIQSSNGVEVKGIDFIDANGNVDLNIFLLQDNGNTLYFGLPACPVNDLSCGLRSTEINYASPYTRIN